MPVGRPELSSLPTRLERRAHVPFFVGDMKLIMAGGIDDPDPMSGLGWAIEDPKQEPGHCLERSEDELDQKPLKRGRVSTTLHIITPFLGWIFKGGVTGLHIYIIGPCLWYSW